MTNDTTPAPIGADAVDGLMQDIQSFASAWSLVGGRFDAGDGLEYADALKAELRNKLVAALAGAPQPTAVPPGYVPVPVEPTDDMLRGLRKQRSGGLIGKGDRAAWAAWLAAAPKAAPAATYDHGPQAETIEEAARDVGKWLNERPSRPLDLRHVAMLCAHAQAAPAAQGDARRWLQAEDMAALERFAETTDDDEDYDIGKDAVQRLAGFGCLRAHGFGKYSITDFGRYLLNDRSLARELPFRTRPERDTEQRAARAAKEGGADVETHAPAP